LGLGDDHPDILRSASNRAADLRRLGEHNRPIGWSRTWHGGVATGQHRQDTAVDGRSELIVRLLNSVHVKQGV
jgi:hypothetical protein